MHTVGRDDDQDLPSNILLRKREQLLAQNLSISVQACHWYTNNTKGEIRPSPNGLCEEAINLAVFNPWEEHSRYLRCITTFIETKQNIIEIPPQGFAMIPTDCMDLSSLDLPLVHLFPAEPVLPLINSSPHGSNDHRHPNPNLPMTQLTGNQPELLEPQIFPCDVPCERRWREDDEMYLWINNKWFFVHSMEAAGYYKVVAIQPDAYKGNKYYATTSFKAEVPMPYFSFDEYNLFENEQVDFETAIKGASFLARNCRSHNDRESIVRDLMDVTRVDALGHCLKNADFPNNTTAKDSKQKIIRQYLINNTCT